MTPRALAAVLAVLLGGAASAAGEEPKPGKPPESFDARYAYGMGVLENGVYVVSMVEGVSLNRGALSVDARSMVLWMDPEKARQEGGSLSSFLPAGSAEGEAKPAPAPAEGPPLAGTRDVPEDLKKVLGPVLFSLYAEGDVVFRLGTRTIRAERLYVDFRKNILSVARVRMSSSISVTQRGRSVPLLIRADRMRRTSLNTLLFTDAAYTTCDFEEPHYRFRCREFLLADEEDHTTLTGWRNVLDVEGVPLFYLPVLSARSDATARPLRTLTYKSSSRFGQEVDVLWGDDILTGGSLWGEWRLRTDYRTSRGPGVGPELKYDYRDAEGELLTYWQKDHADTDDFNGSAVPRDERGRVRWEHRQRLAPDLRLDLSLSDFSDRNFLPEYLKDEFLNRRDPETYAYLRWARKTDLASLSARVHNDAFRTETTELPEGAFHRIGAPVPGAPAWLFDDLTWSADARAGAYERLFDESLGIRGDREVREDAVARLQGVRWAGPVSLQPFLLGGATAWHGLDRPGERGGRQRGDLAGGVRATVEARGDFPDARSDWFGFRGLRHLVEVQGLWYDRWAVTEDPLGPGAVDRIDTLEEARVLELRLRNRLQANRGGRRVDWIDLELRGYHFPSGLDRSLSPLRFKEEGLDEARFQDFAGEEKYRALPPRGEWGPCEADLRVWLRENLFLLGEGEYDPYADEMRTAVGGVRWFLAPSFSFWAGNRRIAGDSNIVSLSADWAFSERWIGHVSQQTDFRKEGSLSTEAGIRRVWHDFVLEFNLKRDFTTHDLSVSFTLMPSFLWTVPTSAERLGKLDYEAQKWYR